MTALAFVGAAGASNDSLALSLASSSRTLTAGNHNYVFVTYYGSNSATISIADTAGNTYTPLAIVRNTSGSVAGQWFYVHNATGHASNVVTATYSAIVQFHCIRVIELSGTAPTVTQASNNAPTGNPYQVDPGLTVGDGGSALLTGYNPWNSLVSTTFSEYDNEAALTWSEAYAHYNYGGVGYALVAAGADRAGVGPQVNASGTQGLIVALGLSLGIEPASDTKAHLSQVAAEVLRTNTAVVARTSQVAVEVLRTNTATKARTSQVAVEVLRPNMAAAANARPVVFVAT